MSQPQLIAQRYEVISSLGEGGFAHVYKALDKDMGRTVAIKILKLELLGHATLRETFLERFSREVNITASLEHPHLVPVYDTGMTSDEHGHERPYLVMKLLDGEDLESVLEGSGPLSAKDVMTIGSQVLDALAYVHEQGVVHKDLKPANIFLSKNRRGEPHAYVMDFGIAHDPRGGAGRMTQNGAFTGTLQYLAPEYLLEQIAEPCVDVFQMGLILLELLCSRPMVSEETTMPELIAYYIQRLPIELPLPFTGTSSGDVLRRATLFDHEARYRDAGAFLEAWERLESSDFPTFTGSFSALNTISGGMAAISSQRTKNSNLADTSYGAAPAPKSQKKLILVACVLLCLIAFCAIAVALLADPQDDEPVPELPKVVVTPKVIKKPVTPKVLEPPAKQPDAPVVMRTITTSPVGAKVFVDGELRGESPVQVSAERAFDVRVELKGYTPFEESFDEDASEIEVELKKKRSTTKRPRPPKKPKDPTKPVEKKPKDPAKSKEPAKPTTTLPPEF